MSKEFIPYELALAMKELGFDGDCLGYYNIDPQLKNPAFNMVKPFEHEWCLPAPLYQQAFGWFREEYELYGSVGYNDDLKSEWGGSVKGYYETWGKYDLGFTGWFKTYQEAQDACLRKLIKILNQNKDE